MIKVYQVFKMYKKHVVPVILAIKELYTNYHIVLVFKKRFFYDV